jgi:hypothetical protein
VPGSTKFSAPRFAYEVCHLLLGEQHSLKGIMRAHWGREEE